MNRAVLETAPNTNIIKEVAPSQGVTAVMLANRALAVMATKSTVELPAPTNIVTGEE